MSLGHGSSAVKNGLVLHYDSTNIKSYSGSGTILFDLSGLGNHGTLTNGASISSGLLTLDGVDDYINVGSNSSYSTLSSITIELVTRRSSTVSNFYQVLMSNTRDCCGVYDGFQMHLSNATTASPQLTCNLWNSSNYNGSDWTTAFTSLGINNVITTNSWFHICFTYDLASGSFRGYVNGTLRSIITKANALSNNQASFGLQIGRSPSHGAPMNGQIPISKIYNRALSANEIRQNFEAIRGRYGI